ncbi:MAG: hypothetical protein DIU61_011920 [Bacteroidota bacterium]|jgi:hypothetical protein|nr:MAG: hypothetical protein DIU61_16750 [Bacteroidota bacterium]
MKILATLACVFFIATGFTRTERAADDQVEFVCVRKQLARNMCHYNFVIAGARYRYVDMGCKFRDTREVIDRARTGRIALARHWQIDCPMASTEGKTGVESARSEPPNYPQ